MPATILAVDDETDVTELVAYHLRRSGYEVRTAASGRTALDQIRHLRPDLVILDLMLPDIDGFGVCEIVRHDPLTATLPIIILSAWATPDARHLGLELGALDYVTKPFSPGDLMRRVQRLLDQRPLQAANPRQAVAPPSPSGDRDHPMHDRFAASGQGHGRSHARAQQLPSQG